MGFDPISMQNFNRGSPIQNQQGQFQVTVTDPSLPNSINLDARDFISTGNSDFNKISRPSYQNSMLENSQSTYQYAEQG